MSSIPLFQEAQSFSSPLIWKVLLAILVFAMLLAFFTGRNPRSSVGLVLTVACGLVPVTALAAVTLVTRIYHDRIVVGFSPFRKRTIFRKEVKNAHLERYDGRQEYGGWGYRKRKSGKAFITHGDQGLLLELHSGERLLIGTQQADQLNKVLRQW